jgi:hypothetical protein
MSLFQKKIWICLMGFSLMSHISTNHAFADDNKETVKEKISEAKNDVKRGSKKGARKLQDKTCEVVDGKTKCVANKAKHSVQNSVDKAKDAAD